MKITLNIETNDPADLERIAAALAGKEVAVTTGKPAATTTKKTETAPSGGAAQASQSAQAGSGQGASTAASGSDAGGAAVPSDADLIAAANTATGKVGNGGPDKVKTYIANNFKKADGSPGTLKTTAEGDRARLLSDLQKIGRGEITL
jgi:hypothetical protein